MLYGSHLFFRILGKCCAQYLSFNGTPVKEQSPHVFDTDIIREFKIKQLTTKELLSKFICA